MARPEPMGETVEYQELQERLESLYSMTLALAETATLDEMLDVVLKQIHHTLVYDSSFVTLATDDGQALRVRASAGDDAERLLSVEFSIEQGINAWIYREGKPALIGDADTDPRRLHIEGRTEPIRAAIGVPLIVDGQPIGTIYAARRQPHTFTQSHLDFLTMTAAQVAAAIQRAHLLDQARQRAEELETLLTIGAVMASTLDLDEVLLTIYEQAGRVMDTSAFFVALYDSGSDELRFSLVYDRDERLEPFAVRFAESQGLTAYVIRTAQPLLVRNWELERDGLPVEPLIIGDSTLSWLGVPIIIQDQVLGAIGAQSYEPYAFTNRQLRLMSAIANQAGISLQNARLVSDLKLLNTDLQEMVNAQAHLLQTIEEMLPALNLEAGSDALRRLIPGEKDHG